MHAIISHNGCRNVPVIERMEWLHNGTVIEMVANTSMITLSADKPLAGAGGRYSCVVHFTNGTSQEADAGFLIIYSECIWCHRIGRRLCRQLEQFLMISLCVMGACMHAWGLSATPMTCACNMSCMCGPHKASG
jgi:hypothetical protein